MGILVKIIAIPTNNNEIPLVVAFIRNKSVHVPFLRINGVFYTLNWSNLYPFSRKDSISLLLVLHWFCNLFPFVLLYDDLFGCGSQWLANKGITRISVIASTCGLFRTLRESNNKPANVNEKYEKKYKKKLKRMPYATNKIKLRLMMCTFGKIFQISGQWFTRLRIRSGSSFKCLRLSLENWCFRLWRIRLCLVRIKTNCWYANIFIEFLKTKPFPLTFRYETQYKWMNTKLEHCR